MCLVVRDSLRSGTRLCNWGPTQVVTSPYQDYNILKGCYNKRMDEWIDIRGFEGYYQINRNGLVRSMRNTHRSKRGFILKERKDSYGYVEYKLMIDGQYYFRKAHRLVAQAFIPNPKNLETVNHKNGNKNDNRVENLEWMSRGDNARHSLYVLGNLKKGSQDPPLGR